MKVRKHVLSLFLISLLLFLTFTPAALVSADSSYVSDEAGLLEDSEEKALNTTIQKIASSSSINVRIFTVNTLNGRNGTYYLDDMEDQLNISNAVFILIDMSIDDPDNRAYYINTFDDMNKTYFNQKRRDSIRDAAIKELKNGDYYGGLRVSLEMIESYSKTNIRTDNILYQSWLQLLICMAISGIIVFYMAYTAGGKITTSAATYMNPNTSRLLGRYDHYIRTTTTRVKREQNNSGGSGTHSTSGGHSSGSSSGKF